MGEDAFAYWPKFRELAPVQQTRSSRLKTKGDLEQLVGKSKANYMRNFDAA